MERCLNCDVQTHFTDSLCIECDACIDICPTDCLTIAEGEEGAKDEGRRSKDERTPNGKTAPSPITHHISQFGNLESRLTAPRLESHQPLFVSGGLKQTGRVMVKDENLCLHCGLCAERCPTYAWDMRKSIIHLPYAGRPVPESTLRVIQPVATS